MSIELHEVVGAVGSALIVGCFLLSERKKLDPHGAAYYGANGLGAAAVLFSLLHEWNTSAFVIECFWLGISVLGLAGLWRKRAGGAG